MRPQEIRQKMSTFCPALGLSIWTPRCAYASYICMYIVYPPDRQCPLVRNFKLSIGLILISQIPAITIIRLIFWEVLVLC